MIRTLLSKYYKKVYFIVSLKIIIFFTQIFLNSTFYHRWAAAGIEPGIHINPAPNRCLSNVILINHLENFGMLAITKPSIWI